MQATELYSQFSENATPKIGVLNVELALKLRIYRSLKFNMSQMNPKEVFHNNAYSVKLPYIAGHSLSYYSLL